jgi:hemerythrin
VKYAYDGYDEHKADHRELIDGVRELQQNILGSNKQVSDEELLFLERWLTEHILTDDMRLGSFLAEKM